MEMYQIRYFLAVCETLNFTRAAEKCFVSQPSLTKAIQKLEDDLGGRLFTRTKNSVQLTELGQIMQPNLTQLYSAVRLTKEQAKNFISSQHTRLSLGIMCTISLEPMVDMLKDFALRHPMIELRFREGTLEQLTDAIDKSDIDMAILAAPSEFPKRFDTQMLYPETFVIACPPRHRFSTQKTIELPDLHKEPYVVRANCEYAEYIGERLDDLGVELRIEHSTEREDWVQTMIRAGMGIAFMPENTCMAAKLSFCRLEKPHIERGIQVVTLATKEKTKPMQAFLKSITAFNWQAANAAIRLQEAA